MKIAIVTGASTGIGRAAAQLLASRGLQVLACVRRAQDAEKWKAVPNATPLLLDVTSEESLRAAVEECAPRLSAAETVHLVNNAGIAVAGPVESVPLARWREQFEVNVFGLVRATQAFLPWIRPTRGRIVNVSSVSGLVSPPYLGPYSASKFAVEAISDALRRELRQFGVHVAVVEPGPIATPIWEKGLGGSDAFEGLLPEEQQKIYGRDLRRMRKIVEIQARGAVPAERAALAIEQALTARRPRTRYLVGRRAMNASTALARHLPDSFLDALIAREFR